MPDDYKVLHYPGDVTSAERAQEGAILGWDDTGRYYEVIDAEYDADANRTTVNLQPATAENVRRAIQSAEQAARQS